MPDCLFSRHFKCNWGSAVLLKMRQGLILQDILQDIFGAHLYFRNVEKTCCWSCNESGELFGVLLEKVLVFIDILAGGKEPGVVSAAPERRNLEIEVNVGWRSWHFLGVVIQPSSFYSSGLAALGCLWVVNKSKLSSQSKLKLVDLCRFWIWYNKPVLKGHKSVTSQFTGHEF